MDPSDLQSRMEAMEARLKGLETNLEAVKPKPSVASLRSDQAPDPRDATKMIKELEVLLARTEEERNQLQSDHDILSAQLDRYRAEYDEAMERQEGLEVIWMQKLDAEQKRSRALFERLQALKGNIRVMCRIRPPPAETPYEDLVDFGPREKGEFSDSWGRMQIPVERQDVTGRVSTDTQSFDFERIFGPEESNNDVFNEISDLVECALQGEKVGIFAYGQTGSGKTFTLSHKDPAGDGLEDGVIPRTVALMFQNAEASLTHNYSISLSILEIYIDSIYDLQEPIDGQKAQTRIEQAKFLELTSQESAEAMIEAAAQLRVSSSTSQNASSSRSHLILTFQIHRERLGGGEEETGYLYLVDLAGSERSAASGLKGLQLQEGIKINTALMSLNLVITALGNGTHVAYDNTLTKALRPVLSHDSKTLMFVMVSPLKKDLVTSIQTLKKGQEATNAKLAAVNRSGTSTPRGTRSVSHPALSSGLGTPTSVRSTPGTPTSGRGGTRGGLTPRPTPRSSLGGTPTRGRGSGRGGR
ncbi:P-loop containing nucleoside triphosphate hydrolase protein [Annulohypoxylon truncatum]|uniref:P-loop containing nucleoside triphosphate hydrolase protein n=1 Tax=Annulohypoxylon truncatum TaxID=327061 RepID=UPI002008956D|nr:P-loop containing nucleoside triphosphate hydrolase protein [Annulohypoxylon truncatum]KAI1209812.1 P-loop containing nucleoside triphosphate hydrolase protein [Annulohypoxylon truncatum]